MSWILKQAEDVLNRLDQQTNAAFHQQTSKLPTKENQTEFIVDTPSFTSSLPLKQPTNNHVLSNRIAMTPIRRIKKTDETDLINYLNSTTPIQIIESNPVTSAINKTRSRNSSNSPSDDSALSSTRNENKEFNLVR